MTSRNEQKCENCRFFLAAPPTVLALTQQAAPSVCRRFPPQSHVARVQRDDSGAIVGNEQMSIVPIVNPGHWCGEWAALPTGDE